MRAYVWNPPNPAYALPQTHDIARFDAGQRGSVGKTVEYALHRYHAKLRLIEAKQFVGERIAQGLADRHHRKLRSRREPVQGATRNDCPALIIDFHHPGRIRHLARFAGDESHRIVDGDLPGLAERRFLEVVALVVVTLNRSAERRVGKECVSTCRSRGWPDHSTKKKKS